MKRILFLSLLLFGCVSNQNPEEQKKIASQQCHPADNINYVSGGGECLRIIITNKKVKPKSLVVIIHGDTSKGGPSDYFVRRVQQLNPFANDMMVVTLIRPGYYDKNYNYSTGSNYGRGYKSYTAHNVDSIAKAIKTLKDVYQPQKLIVVGHSGGAAITANMIGRHHNLVDGAVLSSCPCNIAKWREGHGKKVRKNTRTLSPIDFAHNVKNTSVIAISGSRDKNTFPRLSSEYIDTLQKYGVDAKFILVDASHNGAARSKEFYSSILELAQ